MDLEDILSKKKRGDIALAGQMLDITTENASNAFNRPGSKYHSDVVKTLNAIIQNREDFMKLKRV
jgi:hypothetical protein